MKAYDFPLLNTVRLIAATLSAALSALPASASVTSRAAARIENIARADFAIDGAPSRSTSGAAIVIVQEELGIALVRSGEGPIAIRPGIVTAAPFILTNAGNGSEAFVLAAGARDLAATVSGFAIDRDGNGLFDPAIDVRIDTNGVTPALEPGATLALLVLVQTDSASGTGTLDISAHAATGSGRPGTTFPGRGDAGVDAVVGATTASASIAVPIVVGTDEAHVVLRKSQQVLAPDGSDRPIHGAAITYTIEARIDGTGAASHSVVSDPIPEGTDYVAGSLHMDGTVLTDARDGDAGTIDGVGIAVALGDLVAPATRTINFQVKIR